MHDTILASLSNRWPGRPALVLFGLVLIAALAGYWAFASRYQTSSPAFGGIAASLGGSAVEKGAYIFRAAGCAACHTAEDGALLAGGRGFETPFGRFYSTNITPDPVSGIGGWSTDDLIRALREGKSPDGRHYFPAFPYTNYTLMADADIRALKAYLDSVPPVAGAAPAHELAFPLSLLPVDLVRYGMIGWKWLYFEQGPYRSPPAADEVLARGQYLVQGPGHCSACHTPRNVLGAPKTRLDLAGAAHGPGGKAVPAIHYGRGDGIGAWQKEDITFALETGMTPDGDVMGGAMAEVVENGTSYLNPADLNAIASYLMTLTPQDNP